MQQLSYILPSAHGDSPEGVLRPEISFNRLKEIKAIRKNLFSDHNGIKLQVNIRSKYEKLGNNKKLNNIFINDF